MRINLGHARASGQGIVRNILQTSERKLRRNIQKRKSKKHQNWQKITNKFVLFNGSWCNMTSYVARFLVVKGCVTSEKGTACNSRLGYVTNGLFEFVDVWISLILRMICLQKECFNYHVSHCENLDAFISRNNKPWPGALEIPGKILRSWRLYLTADSRPTRQANIKLPCLSHGHWFIEAYKLSTRFFCLICKSMW